MLLPEAAGPGLSEGSGALDGLSLRASRSPARDQRTWQPREGTCLPSVSVHSAVQPHPASLGSPCRPLLQEACCTDNWWPPTRGSARPSTPPSFWLQRWGFTCQGGGQSGIQGPCYFLRMAVPLIPGAAPSPVHSHFLPEGSASNEGGGRWGAGPSLLGARQWEENQEARPYQDGLGWA